MCAKQSETIKPAINFKIIKIATRYHMLHWPNISLRYAAILTLIFMKHVIIEAKQL